MPDRKTLELKRRKQRAVERRRAEEQAERDRIRREQESAENWMRFVAIRFPGRYRPRPNVEDFMGAFMQVLDEHRQAEHAKHGGPPPYCIDRGHEFLCRFGPGSCRGGMCNDD